MNWMTSSAQTFQREKQVFLREQANKMYSPLVYFISKNLVEMPGTFIGPMLTLLIIYWGIDYVSFFKVYLTMFLVAQIGFGLGLTISSLAQPGPNSGTALTLF